jgi:hypothetical protein
VSFVGNLFGGCWPNDCPQRAATAVHRAVFELASGQTSREALEDERLIAIPDDDANRAIVLAAP